LGLTFPYVIEIDGIDGRRGEQMTYDPRSDFGVSIRGFPHIILEVNSEDNETDKFRMFLQAACLSRIGNSRRDQTSQKPIVIMAIYVDKNIKAYQYILCQPNVESAKVVFDWF
jgi:hypothetical protein